jgi:hypothetical protein
MRKLWMVCLLVLGLSWVASAQALLTAEVHITVPSEKALTEVVLVGVDDTGSKEIHRQVYTGGTVVKVNHTWANESAKLQVYMDGVLRYELVPQQSSAPVQVVNAVSNPANGTTSTLSCTELSLKVAELERRLAQLEGK